jgi:hypothetical protein
MPIMMTITCEESNRKQGKGKKNQTLGIEMVLP